MTRRGNRRGRSRTARDGAAKEAKRPSQSDGLPSKTTTRPNPALLLQRLSPTKTQLWTKSPLPQNAHQQRERARGGAGPDGLPPRIPPTNRTKIPRLPLQSQESQFREKRRHTRNRRNLTPPILKQTNHIAASPSINPTPQIRTNLPEQLDNTPKHL